MKVTLAALALAGRAYLSAARVGESSVSRDDALMYPIKERKTQERFNLTDYDKWKITFSEDSPVKSMQDFYLTLTETDGSLPLDPSIASVEYALQDFVEAEMNAVYAPNHKVKVVEATVESQERTTSDDQVTGSRLRTGVDITFDHEPSPDESDVDSSLQSVMQNLTYFLTNLTARANGDPELANVTTAVRSEVDDDVTPPIVGPTTGSRGMRPKYIAPIIVGACVLLMMITLFAHRRRRRKRELVSTKEIDTDSDIHNIDVVLDEDDIFSVETALIESPARCSTVPDSPVSHGKFASSPARAMQDDTSDIFSGIDSEMASPRNAESRSVFSFFSNFTRGDASTVVASNVTKKDQSGAGMATAAAAVVTAGAIGAASNTPRSRVSSLFTFSEEDSADLTTSSDEEQRGQPPRLAASDVSVPSDEEMGLIIPSPSSAMDENYMWTPTAEAIASVGVPAAAEVPPPADTGAAAPVVAGTAAAVAGTAALASAAASADESSAFGPKPLSSEPEHIASTNQQLHVSADESSFGPKPLSNQLPPRSPRSPRSPGTANPHLYLGAATDVSSFTHGSGLVSPTTSAAPTNMRGSPDTDGPSDEERAAVAAGAIQDEKRSDWNIMIMPGAAAAALGKFARGSKSKKKPSSPASESGAAATGIGKFAQGSKSKRLPSSPASDKGQSRSKSPGYDDGYGSDPGPKSRRGTKSGDLIHLEWGNPNESSRNRAKAAAFVGSFAQAVSSDSVPIEGDIHEISSRHGRRHAKDTTIDGTTNYQTETMDPLDWSIASYDESRSMSISGTSNGLASFTRDSSTPTRDVENEQEQGTSNSLPNTPRSTLTNNSTTTNNSTVSGLSTTYTNGSTSTNEASASKRLISDLVWLEQKIATAAQSITRSPKKGDKGDQPSLKQCDSLSFGSGDGEVSTSGSLDSTIDVASPKTPRSPAVKAQQSSIVCRDCYAPPGKLKIVIHSTKDGPAVHTVKKGSSLEGHIFPGDLIISVDNIDTRSYTAEQVMKMMTARTRFERKITVLHEEEEKEGAT